MSVKSDNFFYSKRKKQQTAMVHECQILYLVTRLDVLRNKDFFGSPLKSFPLEINILTVVELIEEIKKYIGTWGCRISCFRVMAL